MNIAFFSALPIESHWFDQFRGMHRLTYLPQTLTAETVDQAAGHDAVCAFVNDDLNRTVLRRLHALGVRTVGMRCTGLDNVDLRALAELDMQLLSVPGYSPYAVAEQAATLLMGLVRHLPEASRRVRAGDFTIEGLLGTDLHGKTVGVVGTGHIGQAFLRIMQGFGCKRLAYDLNPDRRVTETGVRYVALSTLLEAADVVSLHCPLTTLTDQLINGQTLSLMKPGALLVNTGRGRLVDTTAVLDALDSGQLGGYAADVYENERTYFYHDFSATPIPDERLNRLRQHPRVLLTPHQGYFTDDALQQIARSLLNQFSYADNQQQSLATRASMC